MKDYLRVLIFMSFFCGLTNSVFSQDDQDVHREDKDKLLFFVTKFNIKRYSTTIRPNNFTLTSRGFGNVSVPGIGVEYQFFKGDQSNFKANVMIGNVFGLDSGFVSGKSYDVGVLHLIDFGYWHAVVGGDLLILTKTLKGVYPGGLLALRYHNPTRRFNIQFGSYVYPSKRVDNLWWHFQVGYALGKER